MKTYDIFVQLMIPHQYRHQIIKLPPSLSFSKEKSIQLRAILVVLCLSDREWDVSVLDHMLDLSPHCQSKQNQPINHQNRPENWDIEDREPSAYKANSNSSRGRVPELELWEAADEGTELLVLFRREAAGRAVFHLGVYGFVRGVEFGLQEREEEVQEVDSQRVCHDVPSLRDEYSQEENHEEPNGSHPSVRNIWSRFVQPCLVLSLKPRGMRAHSRKRGLLRLH